MDRPLCKCHGEPMTLRNDRPTGWRCSVRSREVKRREYADPEKRKKALARSAAYKRTPAGRAAQARYDASEKGQARKERYKHSPAYRRKVLRHATRARSERLHELERSNHWLATQRRPTQTSLGTKSAERSSTA